MNEFTNTASKDGLSVKLWRGERMVLIGMDIDNPEPDFVGFASGSFADDNRVDGDGALFIRYAGGETIALFVRFTTQETATDNQTGNPVGE